MSLVTLNSHLQQLSNEGLRRLLVHGVIIALSISMAHNIVYQL